MKLEPGKLYRTRDGRQAMICFTDEHGHSYGMIIGNVTATWWNSDGIGRAHKYKGNDLMGEYEKESSRIESLEKG